MRQLFHQTGASMNKDLVTINQTMGIPELMGVTNILQGTNICIIVPPDSVCSIRFYQDDKLFREVLLLKTYQVGNTYCVLLKDFDSINLRYQIYCDHKWMKDPYAKRVFGYETFGQARDKETIYYGIQRLSDRTEFMNASTSIEKPNLSLGESIMYQLHVRGFTKHANSKVKAKGTFQGIIEKVPYLKELGINSLVLLPAYEFEDVLYNKTYQMPKEQIALFLNQNKKEWESKVNYWGFSDGYYFSPKKAYSYDENPIKEFLSLVETLHNHKMEVIMEMFFLPKHSAQFIAEVLKYWTYYMGVDGFYLLGEELPIQEIIQEPMLQRTKILAKWLPEIEEQQHLPQHSMYGIPKRYFAECQTDYQFDMRRFIKGDADQLQKVAFHMKYQPQNKGIIRFITNYDGFTMMDMVSYDQKHNEGNGEENRDGNDYNHSWNCGIEGETRKKSILELRFKQICNAFSLVLLSQGTPMILAGDEFGHSTRGNNNPYCQDNSINWLNWKLLEKNKKIFHFVKALIELRKSHPILRMEEPLRGTDYISCGYPDISYHCEEAWYPRFENYNRHFALMLCGKYAKKDRKTEDNFFYIAWNSHWIDHEFGLPKLPRGKYWEIYIDTSDRESVVQEQALDQPLEHEVMKRFKEKIVVKPRATIVLISRDLAKNRDKE